MHTKKVKRRMEGVCERVHKCLYEINLIDELRAEVHAIGQI